MQGSSSPAIPAPPQRSTARSSDSEDYLWHGFGRLQEGWLNHAEAALRRFLTSRPDDARGLHLLGVTLFKLGRLEDGVSLIKQAIARERRHRNARGDLALAEQIMAGETADENGADLMHLFSVDRGEYAFTLVDYQYRAKSRYGAGQPPHAGIKALFDAGRDRFAAFIDEIAASEACFRDVNATGSYEELKPFWLNTWFAPFDGMALCAMIRKFRPKLLIEIGSGSSTKFAKLAVAAEGLGTRMVSIDPSPRADIDQLVDEIVRRPLEDVDLSVFDELASGDILFLDSSHRAFQNSDVTAFFLDILPRVRPGVIVHIHDIYLPFDYPSGHVRRLWNEQYLLATLLINAPAGMEILFPSWYVSQDRQLSAQAKRLLCVEARQPLSLHGASIWLRKAS